MGLSRKDRLLANQLEGTWGETCTGGGIRGFVCSVKAVIRDCVHDPAGVYFYVLLFKHEKGLF